MLGGNGLRRGPACRSRSPRSKLAPNLPANVPASGPMIGMTWRYRNPKPNSGSSTVKIVAGLPISSPKMVSGLRIGNSMLPGLVTPEVKLLVVDGWALKSASPGLGMVTPLRFCTLRRSPPNRRAGQG